MLTLMWDTNGELNGRFSFRAFSCKLKCLIYGVLNVNVEVESFMIQRISCKDNTRDLERWNHAIYNQTWTVHHSFCKQTSLSKMGFMRKFWWMNQEKACANFTFECFNFFLSIFGFGFWTFPAADKTFEHAPRINSNFRKKDREKNRKFSYFAVVISP